MIRFFIFVIGKLYLLYFVDFVDFDTYFMHFTTYKVAKTNAEAILLRTISTFINE